ncbi:MAG: ATP-binding protein, partial [Pseudomonadota bacterium]
KEVKPCDINEVVRTSLEDFKKEKGFESVDFKIDLDSKIPNILINPLHIDQVLQVLVRNAKDAVNEKGKVEIKTLNSDGKIHIEVSDTGCGIPEENIQKVFDPFFTTKSPGKGMGLGLAISYNLIDRYNGTIDVKSKKGEGSKFTVTLPVGKQGV